MKGRCIFKIWVWLVLLLPITVGTVSGVPPKVIQTVPDNGAQDVSPRLRQIRVVFDQDMTVGRNFSICGGGQKYPKIIGNPRWINKHTIVMRVKLVPNHEYELSINCPSAKNFRSIRGESVAPYPIKFRTGSSEIKPVVSATADMLSDNEEAIKELRRAINENYSYYKLRGINWDELFEKYNPAMKRAGTPRKFAEVAARMLANAKDMHLWVKIDGETIGGFRRDIMRNYNRSILKKLVPNWRKRSPSVYTGQYDDGIGYILIDNWSRQHTEALQQAYEAIWKLNNSPALIVDVRPNSGGAEPLAKDFAGCFVDEPVVYAKHIYRASEKPGGFGKPNERVLGPNKRRPKYRGRIVVLMGKANMSSCEAFLLMMKQVPNCKLVGETSYGSSGNPKETDLGNGVTVWLPSWKALRLDGTCFEGEGIKPDVLVKTSKAELTNRDRVLETALKLLRENKRSDL